MPKNKGQVEFENPMKDLMEDSGDKGFESENVTAAASAEELSGQSPTKGSKKGKKTKKDKKGPVKKEKFSNPTFDEGNMAEDITFGNPIFDSGDIEEENLSGSTSPRAGSASPRAGNTAVSSVVEAGANRKHLSFGTKRVRVEQTHLRAPHVVYLVFEKTELVVTNEQKIVLQVLPYGIIVMWSAKESKTVNSKGVSAGGRLVILLGSLKKIVFTVLPTETLRPDTAKSLALMLKDLTVEQAEDVSKFRTGAAGRKQRMAEIQNRKETTVGMHAMHSLKAWSTTEEMEAAIKMCQFEVEQISVGPDGAESKQPVILNVGQMAVAVLDKADLIKSYMYSELLLWVADTKGLTIVPTTVNETVRFKTKQSKTIRDLMTRNAMSLMQESIAQFLAAAETGAPPPTQCFVRSIVDFTE